MTLVHIQEGTLGLIRTPLSDHQEPIPTVKGTRKSEPQYTREKVRGKKGEVLQASPFWTSRRGEV